MRKGSVYLLVVDEPLEDGGGVPAAALAAHPRRPARLDRQTLLRPLQKSSLSLPETPSPSLFLYSLCSVLCLRLDQWRDC